MGVNAVTHHVGAWIKAITPEMARHALAAVWPDQQGADQWHGYAWERHNTASIHTQYMCYRTDTYLDPLVNIVMQPLCMIHKGSAFSTALAMAAPLWLAASSRAAGTAQKQSMT
jgi:hypothetical protein